MHPRHKYLSNLMGKKLYHEAQKAAISHIKEFPLDGQGWLILGESLMKQNMGDAARLMFNRAILLDPKAKWMPLMEKELLNVPRGFISEDFHQLLEVPKVSVTAAIIAKDEERCIERCLKSIMGAVDEIIVIDSGSTDQTLHIIDKFPNVQVVCVEWADDFAQLRNEALARVTTDWVFWIDADEWLYMEDKELIRTAAGIYHSMNRLIPALQPCLINHLPNKDLVEFSVPRLFQTQRGIYYIGRIHEQLATEDEGIFTSNILHKPVGIRVHHDGYIPEIKFQKDKINRNLKLLMMMTEEDPSNAGWWYFLGRESMNQNDNEQSLAFFEKAIQYGESNPRFGRLPEIYVLMGKIHSSAGHLSAAEEYFQKALSVYPDFPDAHFQLAQLAVIKADQQLKLALSHINQAGAGFQSYRGPVTPDQEIHLWKAAMLKAEVYLRNGHLADAFSLLRETQEKVPDSKIVNTRVEYIVNERQKLNIVDYYSIRKGGKHK